jgi:hypothetical protein
METLFLREQHAAASRRKLALLLLGAMIVVALLLAAFAYGIMRPKTADVEFGERRAVEQCWQDSKDLAQSRPSRMFQEEACREMEKQFRLKFEHQRLTT